jgi:Cu/Ag efflux pump CusA
MPISTKVFGMNPLAIGIGEGAEITRRLALIVSGVAELATTAWLKGTNRMPAGNSADAAARPR